MSETAQENQASGAGWTLLCCWEGVLAYGPFAERLAVALSLQCGACREDVVAALEKVDLRALARGALSLEAAAEALDAILERGIDEIILKRAIDGALYFRISGMALLESMRKKHRTVVIGDAPPGLDAVLRGRIGPLVGEDALVLSGDVGCSFREQGSFAGVLDRHSLPFGQTVLVGGDEATREEAAGLGIRCFEIPRRMRTAWSSLRRFLEEVAEAPLAEIPVVAMEAVAEGGVSADDDADPGVADPVDPGSMN